MGKPPKNKDDLKMKGACEDRHKNEDSHELEDLARFIFFIFSYYLS